MKKAFDIVLHFGTWADQPAHDKRKIKTNNFLNLIMAFFLTIGYTNYFILGSDFALVPVTVFLTLAIFCLFLNKINLTKESFLLFTINVNLSIFYINQLYPIEVGAYLFYFPLIVSVVLLNHPSFKDKYSLIHFGVCAAFFGTSILVDIPSIELTNLTQEKIRSLWYYDLIMAAAVTAVLSFLLARLIATQNKEIIDQNVNLMRAQEAVNISLKEKEILLAELHHRVKNNLAIISGLLNLQEDATSNVEAKQIIGDSKSRIMSMALVHKMLYENTELKSINIGRYASELINELFKSYNLLKSVAINEDYDSISLSVNKSIPFGLILNEVITNSIKYTYKSDSSVKGVFSISVKLNGDFVNVVLRDNGRGFPEGFNPESDTRSLGIYLIKTLSEQIDGEVHFSNDGGAKIELNFLLN